MHMRLLLGNVIHYPRPRPVTPRVVTNRKIAFYLIQLNIRMLYLF
jgi:hypothetical protein